MTTAAELRRSAKHVVWVRSVLFAQMCQASALAAVQSGVYAFVPPHVFASPGTYAACITTGAVVLCLLSIVIGKSVSLPPWWNTAAGVLWTTAWAVLLLGLSVYLGMHTFVVVTVSLSTAIGLVAVVVYVLTVQHTTQEDAEAPPPSSSPSSSSSGSGRRRHTTPLRFTSHAPVRKAPRPSSSTVVTHIDSVVSDGDSDSNDDGGESAKFLPSPVLQNIVTPFQVKVLFVVLGLVVVLCVALFHADIHVSAQDTVVWACVWSLVVTGVFADAWFMIRAPVVDPGVYVDAITPSLLVHAHVMRAAACFRGHRRA